MQRFILYYFLHFNVCLCNSTCSLLSIKTVFHPFSNIFIFIIIRLTMDSLLIHCLACASIAHTDLTADSLVRDLGVMLVLTNKTLNHCRLNQSLGVVW